MNPYLSASKIAPHPGQRFAVVSYQLLESNKNSDGVYMFMRASDSWEELDGFARYLKESLKIPNVSVVDACQTMQLRRFSQEGGAKDDPPASRRTMLEAHKEDMEWFHPIQRVRTHARLLKYLKDGGNQTTHALAQLAEWGSEMDQLQKLIIDLSNQYERQLRGLADVDLTNWEQAEYADLVEASDSDFADLVLQEVKKLRPVAEVPMDEQAAGDDDEVAVEVPIHDPEVD